MTDNPYPVRPAAPARASIPGEHRWTFTRGSEQRRAELRDHGRTGAELQVYVNGEFASGRRYENRALATIDADALRDTLEMSGWTCRRCQGERWMCEAHPDLPSDHDPAACAGPGVPCPDCNTSEPPRPPKDFVSYVRNG